MKKYKKILFIATVIAALALVTATDSPAPVTIFVYMDKPYLNDVIKKTDDVKIKGDIDGLEAGKTYVLSDRRFT